MTLEKIEQMFMVSKLFFDNQIPRGLLSPKKVQVSKRYYHEAVALIGDLDIILEVKD